MMTIFWDMIPCSMVERTNNLRELDDCIFWVKGNHTKWNVYVSITAFDRNIFKTLAVINFGKISVGR